MKWRQRAHLGSMGRKHDMHDGMAMSVEREAALGRGKRGDDASWADTNLTEPKNEENQRGRFSYYKWMVKI
jgi:hypothetical protein